ncbi:MAG: biotin/lipoyl-binding protein [Bacteroidaceae bacterium]|nr:biotin/lipoyl-binding protein [Bacteroidaceae bacterium]
MKEIKFKLAGQDYTACIEEEKGAGALKVTLNGQTYNVEIETAEHKAPVANPAAAAPKASQQGGPANVNSELPGTVTKIVAQAGQHVKRGDVLLVIESMKMANDIVSEVDGTVQRVAVSEGANVNQGDLLVEMVADFVAAEAPALAPKPAPAAPKPVAAPAPAAPKPAAGANAVTAPLPGTITKITVKVGDVVKAGDQVLLMEAMKMENSITAESAGTVKAILVEAGAQVQSGQALVELA